ncbi:MAG: hypothetical protein K2Q26_07290 [Bdellovibrionales bacterium]|nr:hypothetical protein [Bdellovibrionales bacterium]
MKLNFLIGHRGIGKTSLLHRIQRYLPRTRCIDLDAEIIKTNGSIKEIFKDKGEPYFRQLEIETLADILKSLEDEKNDVYIVLGAGFSGELPEESEKLWVQRDSDILGNIYSDRPSLNPDTNEMQTPLERWQARTALYEDWATEELILREGHYDYSESEKDFFQETLRNVRGGFTLLPRQVDCSCYGRWIRERAQWGLDFVEIRDDLLSLEQIQKVLETFPRPSLLFSFRDKNKIEASLPLALKCEQVDWPLEISFDPPQELLDRRLTLSLHSSSESFLHDLKLISGFDQEIKWSPEIDQLNHLELAHEWQQKSPLQRSLLPRSPSGKWNWYRLLMKNRMPLSFWREGEGSTSDQPFLLQWHETAAHVSSFAAVLGSPVRHSESPSFHQSYFSKLGTFLIAIDVTEKDLREGGWEFLGKLGLKWAAVTSPLKTWASQFSPTEASVNTLKLDGVWRGMSTDRFGLQRLFLELDRADIDPQKVVVWGGGGLLPVIKDLLPQATFYSHRAAAPLDQNPVENPEAVIWCVGRWNWEKAAHFPPIEWSPEMVIDVNYKLDSPGIAYAHKVDAQYISGYILFEAQAAQQQEFWSMDVM